MSCGDSNVINGSDADSNLYDEKAIDFLEDIVQQIESNYPDYYNICYCDSNENEILDPLELHYLDWEFSDSEETYFLKGISFLTNGDYIDSIPKSIQFVNSLENIYIRNSKISEIPLELFNLNNLKLIDFSDNNIEEIPDEFMELDSTLKFVNFSGNNLYDIPPTLLELNNIEVINLNNNYISSMPTEICGLNSNVEISVTQNLLCLQENVPECFEDKIELQTKCYSDIDIMGIEALIDSNNIIIEDCNCDLNMNGVIEPFEFGEQKWQEWTESARLIEYQVPLIQSFPKFTYESFTELEYLNLSHNLIDTIFQEIDNLTKLVELDLSYNLLKELPYSMLNLFELRKLKLQRNDSLLSMPILAQLDEINISHTNLFCKDSNNVEAMIIELENNNINIIGAYMQYCYMSPDIIFIEDLIEANGYLSNWEYTGYQQWDAGRLTQFNLNNEAETDIIPISIGNLTNLTHLEISNANIYEIPSEIENLAQLLYLDIKNNDIDSIQFDLSMFNELQYLDLSLNELYHFPESVCELPLVEINFEKNRICDELNPPCSIYNWDEQILTQRCKNGDDILFIEDLIEQNSLDYNYYDFGTQVWSEIDGEEFDRLIIFSHIRGVDSDDTLQVIPTNISNLNYVENLSLINHFIESIPNELVLINTLRELNLKSNKINTLPAPLNGLDSLNLLVLAQNQLTIIPDAIGELMQLKELDLSDNQIITLPNSIGELSNLEILNISDNHIIEIPGNIENLISLISLDISGNLIDSLPNIWCDQLQVDWTNPEHFIANDNNLCNEENIPNCITIDFLNQNCD